LKTGSFWVLQSERNWTIFLSAVVQPGDELPVRLTFLPRDLISRRKRGFVLPLSRWMHGPLQAYVNDGLHRVATAGLVAPMFLNRARELFAQREAAWARVWQLVVLGHWVSEVVSITGTVYEPQSCGVT
jgi:hypothetical protein